MTLTKLDHINVRTADLAGMVRFYTEILELREGDRPPFSFNGSWLYCGEQPIIHLVEVGDRPDTVAPRMEHYALAGNGLAGFLDTLRSHKVAYQVRLTPGWEVRQVHLHDPDGNHLHVDFAADEEADLSPYPG